MTLPGSFPFEGESVLNRAGQLRRCGALDEAANVLREGARRFHSDAALLNRVGLALLDCGRTAEAAGVFERVVELLPSAGAACYNLANAVRAAGDAARSIGLYRRALALGTVLPEVWNNLGLAYADCGDPAAAADAYAYALRQDPRFVPAALNRAYLHIQGGTPQDAVPLLRGVLAGEPECADAHWLLSHALLVQGEFQEGWREYEWRWEKMRGAPYRRTDPERQWRGESLGGQRILLYAEQGLGDAVQFIRYAPLVAGRGGRVVVECHPELVELFQSVDGVAEVHARGAAIPSCACECPLLSLPGVCGTTLSTIPARVPYVHVDPHRLQAWRERVADGSDGLRVGLVWAGSPAHRNDAHRSISSGHLIPLGLVGGVRLYSLQKGHPGDERILLPVGLEVTDLADGLHDLAETAAAVQAMDLIVTVDTAVAHVAGAAGVPVWLLLPRIPDWRWMTGRRDSPWYPSMRLYRQGADGSWESVIAEVVRDLALLAAPA